MTSTGYPDDEIDYALSYLLGNTLGCLLGGFVAAQTAFLLFFSTNPIRKSYFRVILSCLVLLVGFLGCLLAGEHLTLNVATLVDCRPRHASHVWQRLW